MAQLLPELFPHIAKHCDLITCISLASCGKTIRKEIISPSGLKTINTLKIFTKIESWQEFILKHNLEIMNDKCYLYHPIANCFEYALINNNKELVNLLKSLTVDDEEELQTIMNHAVKYKNHDLIDFLILKSKICCQSELDVDHECGLEVLNYLMERHKFNPKTKTFQPTNKEVCLYLYENKLLCVSKYWSKIWYQDVKLFELLLDDGIIQRNFKQHLGKLLRYGTLECLTLFIKRYPSEYNNYVKEDAIVQSLHDQKLFRFLIDAYNIDLLTVSPETIRTLYDKAIKISTLDTIDYLFQYLTHTMESLSDDLIFALHCPRTDVCDLIFDKINQLCPSQHTLLNYISTSEYWGNLNPNGALCGCSLIWLHNKIPGYIKWQEVLIRNDNIYDTYCGHDHMALLYFALEELYKDRKQIDKKLQSFELRCRGYIYRHHIKLYKALRR
jgi:hypothetical protein